MDHLPVISDAATAPDDVEYAVFGSWKYDNSGLTAFPLRAGFSYRKGIGKYSRENYTLITDTISQTSAERIAFIQSWLFFGVLIETFARLEISLDLHDFVTMTDGRAYLTLQSLEKYMLQWEALERNNEASARDRNRANVDECLDLADMLAQENLRRQRRYEFIWSLTSQCALSIHLLHEALRHAWGSIYIGTDKLVATTGAGLSSDLPENRMREMGWCPSEIAMLQSRYSVTGRYFACMLRRRGRPMRHADCTEIICNASQIDDSTYVTQHTTANCQCAHIGVNSLELGSVLKEGKIPRISIRPSVGAQEQVGLHIVDSGPYVAISHVWAHGLGNAQSNSLPLCQIRKLHEYVEALSEITKNLKNVGSVAVWIDTFGVPLDRQTRKLALKLLPQTYAKSTCCLVIDEELRQVSRESSLEELCMRLVFSTWARRLWTFQEGIVTWDKLYIQFREGPSSFEVFRDKRGTSLRSSLRLETVEEAKSTLPRVEDIRDTKRGLVDKLTEACKYRTTSRLSDQTFCLASIAGFDVNKIVDATTHEEKMKIFLLEVCDLPNEIIFFKGQKMNLDGFSWAPYSFLNPERTQSIFGVDEEDTTHARCTYHGLQGRWPGFRLDLPAEGATGKDLYYFRDRGSWVIVHSIDAMQKKLHGSASSAQDLSTWQQLFAIPKIALLIHSLDQLQKLGLLVTIIGESLQFISARPLLTVAATPVPVDEVDIFDPSQLDPNKAIEIRGDSIAENTIWNLV